MRIKVHIIQNITQRMFLMLGLGIVVGMITVLIQLTFGQLSIIQPVKAKPDSMNLPPKATVMTSIRPKLIPRGAISEFEQIPYASASNASYDSAAGYILVDLDTHKILKEKNSQKRLPIASLTKLMTAIVTLDLADPEHSIRITHNAAKQIPTKIGVVAGESMSVEELLHASLLTSANDAAEALKDGINEMYGQEIFIHAMNEKAHLLRLMDTRFDNPQGFDGQQNYSSALDLARLSDYAMNNYPLIAEIVKLDYTYLPKSSNHKQFDLYNWNGLVGVYPGAIGLKIGNTGKAGKTTIVMANRDNRRLLTVVLGASSVLDRDLWAAELLDLGYAQTTNAPSVALTIARMKEKYATWVY